MVQAALKMSDEEAPLNAGDLLFEMVSSLVEFPDRVDLEERTSEAGVLHYEVRVAESDTGRVLGKQGRIADAIRTVVQAVAMSKKQRVAVGIMTEGGEKSKAPPAKLPVKNGKIPSPPRSAGTPRNLPRMYMP